MKAPSLSSSIRKTLSKQRVPSDSGPVWTKASVLRELKALADPKLRAKMEYFGVRVPHAHGISAPVLHSLAKRIGKDHSLALELWTTVNHEARILATLIGESERVTGAEMERWVRDFDSWDVVDAACCYLYAHAKPAWNKVAKWSRRRKEFEKRAAFSLIAYPSYKDLEAKDTRFRSCLTARQFAQRKKFGGKARVRLAGLRRTPCANSTARQCKPGCGERLALANDNERKR